MENLIQPENNLKFIFSFKSWCW